MTIESAEEFVRLRGSEDPAKYHRAAHDQAPHEVWLDVIRWFPDYRFWVAHNKTIPISILRILAVDPDRRVRTMVAMKRKLPPDMVAMLARDSDAAVRAAAARHRKASPDVISALADDSSPIVREIARQRITES